MSGSRLRGIIVEGTDCSGKTRLIKHLKAHLSRGGWDVVQLGHRPGDQFTRYFTIYSSADRLLLDRAHISEVVYGQLHRRSNRMSAHELAVLDAVVKRDFFVVWCTAPPDLLWERHNCRGYQQPSTTFDDFERAHLLFSDALSATADHIFRSYPVNLRSEPETNVFFEAGARAVLECLQADSRKPAA